MLFTTWYLFNAVIFHFTATITNPDFTVAEMNTESNVPLHCVLVEMNTASLTVN